MAAVNTVAPPPPDATRVPLWWGYEAQQRVDLSEAQTAAAAQRAAGAAFDEIERRARSDAARLKVNLWGSQEQRRRLTIAGERTRELLVRQLGTIEDCENQLRHETDVNEYLTDVLRATEARAAMVEPLEHTVAQLQHQTNVANREEMRHMVAATECFSAEAQLAHLREEYGELRARSAVAEAAEARVPRLEESNAFMQRRLKAIKENHDRQDYLEKQNSQLRTDLKVSEKRLQIVVDKLPAKAKAAMARSEAKGKGKDKAGDSGKGSKGKDGKSKTSRSGSPAPKASTSPSGSHAPATAVAATSAVQGSTTATVSGVAAPADVTVAIEAENQQLRSELLEVTMVLEQMAGVAGGAADNEDEEGNEM